MERQLRAVVYSRVSTDAQEHDGTSLDTQSARPRSTLLAMAGYPWSPSGTPPVVPVWTGLVLRGYGFCSDRDPWT